MRRRSAIPENVKTRTLHSEGCGTRSYVAAVVPSLSLCRHLILGRIKKKAKRQVWRLVLKAKTKEKRAVWRLIPQRARNGAEVAGTWGEKDKGEVASYGLDTGT